MKVTNSERQYNKDAFHYTERAFLEKAEELKIIAAMHPDEL